MFCYHSLPSPPAPDDEKDDNNEEVDDDCDDDEPDPPVDGPPHVTGPGEANVDIVCGYVGSAHLLVRHSCW